MIHPTMNCSYCQRSLENDNLFEDNNEHYRCLAHCVGIPYVGSYIELAKNNIEEYWFINDALYFIGGNKHNNVFNFGSFGLRKLIFKSSWIEISSNEDVVNQFDRCKKLLPFL